MWKNNYLFIIPVIMELENQDNKEKYSLQIEIHASDEYEAKNVFKKIFENLKGVESVLFLPDE